MKLLFPLLFIFFTASYLFSFDENGELAKVYLQKSHYYYNLGQFDICKEYLNKSLNYSDEIPEYYYISNLILTSDKKNKFQKAQNSLKIVSYIEKSFLIKKYNMLQNAAQSFKNVRDFEKTFETYSLIFKINDEDLKKDYFDCIDSLFDSKIRGRLKDVIASAKSVFTDPDLDYYEVLYYAMENKIERKDFDRKVSSLVVLNYNPIKIFYLKTLYYSDGGRLFEEYFGLKNKNDNKLLKKIIFNIMQKKKGVSDKQIVSLLNEWLNLGFLSDYYTNLILNNPKISKIIKSKKNLNDAFLNYTGARIKDEDEDGDYEGYEEYTNGVLTLEVFDSNQDGINEYSIAYDEKSVVKNLTIFNKSDDYSIYNFNEANKSLDNVEIVKKGEIIEKKYLIKSIYFPDKLDILKNKDISKENIDYKEIYEEGYSYFKYDKGKIVYEYADNDKNGYFESKKFYENDEILYAIRDTDENGFYEIKEMYRKGKIYGAYYKTNDIIDKYDYIENISDDKTEKMWDDNL
ncbi:MAG TPA: hypothetical protein PLO89_06450, partial [Spirochaetota bacterium]|nr:hypothetical protein [Spirochaetota bacterium]